MLRRCGCTQPSVAACAPATAACFGRLLTFEPAYPFQPGEVVCATTWAAGAANQPARSQLWQFTVAVGGTGRGNFLPGTDLSPRNLAPGVVLGDVDHDGDLDLLTASTSASQVRVRLNGGDASGSSTGQYDAGTLVEIGHPAYSLALGNVDGDGDLDLDLLAGSDSYGTVSIRLNGGAASGADTGRFGEGMEVSMGTYAAPLVEGLDGIKETGCPRTAMLLP